MEAVGSESAEELRGNLALGVDRLFVKGQKATPVKARFGFWKGKDEALVGTGVKDFGPILWSQYTRQGSGARLSVQMAPVGAQDSQEVALQIADGEGGWLPLGQAAIDPLARTAVFAVELPNATQSYQYRVSYPWQGAEAEWQGAFIADPAVTGEPLKIGVFACDHGYAFPLPTLGHLR